MFAFNVGLDLPIPCTTKYFSQCRSAHKLKKGIKSILDYSTVHCHDICNTECVSII